MTNAFAIPQTLTDDVHTRIATLSTRIYVIERELDRVVLVGERTNHVELNHELYALRRELDALYCPECGDPFGDGDPYRYGVCRDCLGV